MSKQRSIALGAVTVVLALAVVLLATPLLSSGVSRVTPVSAGQQTSAPAQVTSVDTRSTLIVTGIGTASVAPDVARVEVGVESRASNFGVAKEFHETRQRAFRIDSSEQLARCAPHQRRGMRRAIHGQLEGPLEL